MILIDTSRLHNDFKMLVYKYYAVIREHKLKNRASINIKLSNFNLYYLVDSYRIGGITTTTATTNCAVSELLEISWNLELYVQLFFWVGEFLKLIFVCNCIIKILKKGSLASASEIITSGQLMSPTETANNTEYSYALLFIRTLYGAILSFVSCACEQGCIMTSKLCL